MILFVDAYYLLYLIVAFGIVFLLGGFFSELLPRHFSSQLLKCLVPGLAT